MRRLLVGTRRLIPIGGANGNGHGLDAADPRPARLGDAGPLVAGGGRLGRRLTEVLACGADAIGQRTQALDVEAVELARGLAEHDGRLVDRDVPERAAQEARGVRPRALRVWEVVAPHDVADAYLVPLREVTPPRVRGAEPTVAVEVLARAHGEVLGEIGVELLRAVVAVEHHVHHP